jgi:tetratricopeptide (TPR) repeat protein
MRILLSLLTVLALYAPARADDAGDRELARKRYEMGLMLFQRGKWGDALAELQAAKAALDRPEFDYNIGLCLAKLGRAREAAEALQRFVEARPDDPQTPSIRARISELRAQPEPRAPEPEFEHPPLPQVAAPSPAPSTAPAPLTEPVPPGVTALPDKNAPPPPRQGWSAFVRSGRGAATFALGGLAVVTLVTSAATGGTALTDKNQYVSGCGTSDGCDHGKWQTAHALAITTDVMISVGVASAVVTTILALTRPRDELRAMVEGVRF